MDVKPRPLSCMKKLSLTCEIKLQIHRPGIEKTLPAGPREAGSSPAGRWQGPGEALGLLRCGAGPPGAPAPLSVRPVTRALPPACMALLTARGQSTGARSVREGFAGSGRQEAESRAGCGSNGKLSRAASRHLPEGQERKDGESFWNMSSARHTLHPA